MSGNVLRPGEVADSESEISRLERTSYEKSFFRKDKSQQSRLAAVVGSFNVSNPIHPTQN
jgi:hypothetical protein